MCFPSSGIRSPCSHCAEKYLTYRYRAEGCFLRQQCVAFDPHVGNPILGEEI